MTATEDLLIIVNAKTVTNLIPASTITIVNERGNRVSTAKFTIENGAGLSLAQWQTVLIYSTDMVTVHFNGFVTGMNTTKKGVQVDYDIDCSSVEVLLQRAIINGNFVGTDGVIIGNMLPGAYPDLSDFFDWSSLITPLLTSDISMDFQDMNLLDALEALAKRAGDAQYSQGYGATIRNNIEPNPALTNNMNFYSPEHIVGAGYNPTWNPANTVYDGSGGETGGGIVITSQLFATEKGFLSIGRTSPASSYKNLFHVNKTDGMWFVIGMRAKGVSAAPAFAGTMGVVTYAEDGTFERSGYLFDIDSINPADGSWQDLFFIFDLSSIYVPDSGWMEFEIMFDASSNSFVVSIDSVICEIVATIDYTSGQLLINSELDAWTGNTPDSWTTTANDATRTIIESVAGGQAELEYITDAPMLSYSSVMTISTNYIVTIDIESIDTGTVRIQDDNGGMLREYTTAGIKSYEEITTGEDIQIIKTDAGAVTVNSVTIYEHSQVTPTTVSYFDGNTADARWLGVEDASPSMLGTNPLNWGTNPDADFDVDIDNMTQTLENFNINFNGFNGINALIVTGGFQWTDVDWIYPNNGNTVSTHFDLEVSVHPAETFTQPLIYTNIGSDVTPNWSAKTVVARQTGFAGGDVLYDLEDHWAEFQDPPPDLELSWRVVGRIKQRIRTTIQNEENIDSTGVELADNYYNDTITTTSDAFDLGQTELARRAPSATVEYDTYEPGLKAGDEQDVADAAQAFSETLIIERVTRTYLGAGYGKFHVELGKYIDGLDDILHSVNNNDEPKVPLGDDTVSLTLRILTDDDGLTLTDDDGLILADIGP